MSLWESCEGKLHIKALHCEPWRVVEDQFHLSSRDLVDSHSEHEILESMIEASKPTTDAQSHYLIFTPFRYPPLKYGSRFAGRYEPSLWYGSLKLKTAFTEVAYYRFKFFRDTTADLGYVHMNMTAFTAVLSSEKSVDLTELPFDQHRSLISDKQNYAASQSLGADMRTDHVEAFTYYSARTLDPEKNIAAFIPSVFQKLHHHQNWVCTTNHASVEFRRQDLHNNEYFGFESEH